MGPEAQREYLPRMRERYGAAPRKEKSRLLDEAVVDEAVAVTGRHRKGLIRAWRAAPRVRRRLALTPATEAGLGRISARQIDRVLAPHRRRIRRRQDGRTRPGTLLKHHIPLRVDRWRTTAPGCTEIDWVAHAGDRRTASVPTRSI